MRSICFPVYFASDERVRLLSGYEKADFMLHFCALAAMNRREPGVIGPWPLTTLSRKLGLPPKRVLKRLQTLSSPEVGLIDIEYDGYSEDVGLTLLSTVRVEIVDFAEWNGLDDAEDDAEGPVSGAFPQASSNGHSNDFPLGPKPGTLRVRKSRAKKAELEQQKARLQQQMDAINADIAEDAETESNALQSQSNAKALQNGHESVTSGVTHASQNGVTPSRGRDDNEKRYSPNLKLNSNSESETLHVDNVSRSAPVTPAVTSSAASSPRRPPNLHAKILAQQAVRIAQQLRDPGSEARHYQLLDICHRNNLADLPVEALNQTGKRMENKRREPLRAPGAYYQDALLRKLGEHGIHVPTQAELEAEPVSEVQRLIRESLDASLPPGVTPLEDIMPEMEDE